VREDEGLVLILEPPFDRAEPSPGYIKGYPPGVRENGGQYTHAAIWIAMALARRGDGTRAAKILRVLNPVERAREPESVWRYGIEPYVVAADVYRLPGASVRAAGPGIPVRPRGCTAPGWKSFWALRCAEKPCGSLRLFPAGGMVSR